MPRLHLDLLVGKALVFALALAAQAGCAGDGLEGAGPADSDGLEGQPASDGDPAEDRPDSGPVDDLCTSVVAEFGLICTTCPGAQPECLVADCARTPSGCLECTDPRGRVALDCSLEFGDVDPSGIGENFRGCYTNSGHPAGTTVSCNHVGTGPCEYSEIGDVFCLECAGGWTMCDLIGQPVPDPSANLPVTHPPPGQCITETDAVGAAQCSACTRPDLTIFKSCRLPPSEYCFPHASPIPPGSAPLCVECVLVGGGSRTICDGSSP